MSLYYIKGSAGTGKSTICKALQELGYEVHDADDDDMGSAYDNATNEKAKIPPIDERTPEWFAAHSYRMIPEAIEALHEKAKDKTGMDCKVLVLRVPFRLNEIDRMVLLQRKH